MRVAVVDDETEAIQAIENSISSWSSSANIPVEIIGFSDSRSFLDSFSPGHYQIVFLDIYIDSTDGLELARSIRSVSEDTMIIFCTTSRENMPEAFRFHAFDYIVKPVTTERMHTLLDDALKVIPSMNRYITFVSNRQDVNLPFSECIWTQSHGHYLRIKSRFGDEYTSRMTTRDFLSQTEGDNRFLQINKGIVANLDHIRRIEGTNCEMTDGTSLPIKIRKAAQISKSWQDYMFSKLREGQK